MNAEVLEASFGSETIRFSVVRRARKTLSISVLPDQQVEVVALLFQLPLALYPFECREHVLPENVSQLRLPLGRFGPPIRPGCQEAVLREWNGDTAAKRCI